MNDLTMTYFEAKDIIRKDLESMSKKFITIGYYLKYIRDNELYIQDGFTSIWEFAQNTYGISKSTCSRWMHMNDKFSQGGNSPYLKQEFASFGKSQLQEMLYLDDTQLERAKPEMTAKEIREIRKPEKQTPDQEESAESLPGQMNIDDYPEVLPEKVPYFTKGGESYGYTWHGVAKEYLQTAYNKGSAKIGFMEKEYLVLKRPERTFFYDDKGNTLFEVENARLEEEYNWLNQKETSVAPPQQNEETEVQQEAKEELQTEPVKVEQQTEKYEQITEKTDIELLKEELEKAQRNLTMSRKEYTEKDIRVRKQKLIVGALAGMIADVDNELPEPVQPPLPKLKNNDQRKEWLRNYQEWGIWYVDENIGAKYYRYQFENGAELIVEEYERNSQYTGYDNSYYFHLVGGPKPPAAKYEATKWTRHETYSKFPSSETELVEFLKEIQK